MVKLKFNIQPYQDRCNMILALANAGYKVTTETEDDKRFVVIETESESEEYEFIFKGKEQE